MTGGYHVTVGGEIQKSAETNQKLAAGFPVALAVMVLAIILQFNSFRRTLLTFVSIPLIQIGIPFGLLATGQPLSFFGTLGIISLSGIIINNAIVLIDQIDIERETLPLRKALVAASEKRLRPILLTSATTVLGLAPMALAGGALWQPMAVLMMRSPRWGSGPLQGPRRPQGRRRGERHSDRSFCCPEEANARPPWHPSRPGNSHGA